VGQQRRILYVLMLGQNFEGDFKLDADDLQKIDGIDKKLRFNDASAGFGWNFYSDLDGKK
jgi:alcohol dehydrogenase (NADP+)